MDIDLFTYVIDWTEYRNLMQSFFDADVIDIEILYDNAMLSVFKDIKKIKDMKITILFSPASASYDQFKNFEERGKLFKKLIKYNAKKYL